MSPFINAYSAGKESKKKEMPSDKISQINPRNSILPVTVHPYMSLRTSQETVSAMTTDTRFLQQ
jgi:hypothetical protein